MAHTRNLVRRGLYLVEGRGTTAAPRTLLNLVKLVLAGVFLELFLVVEAARPLAQSRRVLLIYFWVSVELDASASLSLVLTQDARCSLEIPIRLLGVNFAISGGFGALAEPGLGQIEHLGP